MILNKKAVPKIMVDIVELDHAINKDGWDWLASEAPEYAAGVEQSVDAGYTPNQIYQYMMKMTYRPQIARRCEAAAKYLISQKE